MQSVLRIFLPGLIVLLFLSCKKQEDPAPEAEPEPTTSPAEGSLKIEWRNMVDDKDLVFKDVYLNPKGDTFTVTRFKYYISNVVLTHSDQTKFIQENSYFLMDHSVSSSSLMTLPAVPSGTYSSISFMIGVDSTRNCSGAQTGALDPANGMFWLWSTGYIFLKLEGKAPKSPSGGLTYHVGGYKGMNKAQRTVTLDFKSTPLVIATGKSPLVKMKVNINEIFKAPVLIDVTTQNYQMTEGPQAKLFADNYVDMMSIDKVIN